MIVHAAGWKESIFLGSRRLSRDGRSHTDHAREVFVEALKFPRRESDPGSHHPSGDPSPSDVNKEIRTVSTGQGAVRGEASGSHCDR